MFENAHIRSVYHVRGTGNHVANYTERNWECDDCFGSGMVEMNDREFRQYLRHKFEGQEGIFSEALEIYRRWRATGEVECPACDGRGEWTELT